MIAALQGNRFQFLNLLIWFCEDPDVTIVKACFWGIRCTKSLLRENEGDGKSIWKRLLERIYEGKLHHNSVWSFYDYG